MQRLYRTETIAGKTSFLMHNTPQTMTTPPRPHVHTSTRSYVLILLLLAAGCDLVDLPIDVAPAPTRLVVSSVMGGNETLLVTVSRSFSALSATDVDSLSADFIERLMVDEAAVVLRHGTRTDTLAPLFGVPGLYGGVLTAPEPYAQLALTVREPQTGEAVTATTALLPPVALEAATLTEEIDGTDTTTVLTYRFADPPGESYYVLHAYKLPPSGVLDSLFIGDRLNPLLQDDEAVVFYETLLTDGGPDGESDGGVIADTVRIPFLAVNEQVVMALSHISEGYFRFLEARRRTGGLVSSLANEPVNHPTNVVGGLGFFSAHQPRALVVDKR